MSTLPISVGVLSWHSDKTLINTLKSYQKNGFFEIVSDFRILFQDIREEDILIANKFGLKYIGLDTNVGIGSGFIALAECLSQEHLILLEHDWELVESKETTFNHLEKSLEMIDSGIQCVRLRHRKKYGYPHFSIQRYKGNELEFFDDWIKLKHPHLLDSVHWEEFPDKLWPDKINKVGEFFVSKSRYANWTNNPCLFNKAFYLDVVRPFAGEGVQLEENISYWWARQNFEVAQGDGLFRHSDVEKYGNKYKILLKKLFKQLEFQEKK